MCRRSQDDGFRDIRCRGIEHADECPTGEVARLSEENRKFWHLFMRMFHGLCTAEGGFDFKAIDFVFETYRVPEYQRAILHDRCIIVIDVIREIRERLRQKDK